MGDITIAGSNFYLGHLSKKVCEDCKGEDKHNNDKCSKCNGTGKIDEGWYISPDKLFARRIARIYPDAQGIYGWFPWNWYTSMGFKIQLEDGNIDEPNADTSAFLSLASLMLKYKFQ